MIAGGVAQGENLLTAVFTDKARIIFLKSFGFHFSHLLFSNAEARKNIAYHRFGNAFAAKLT